MFHFNKNNKSEYNESLSKETDCQPGFSVNIPLHNPEVLS